MDRHHRGLSRLAAGRHQRADRRTRRCLHRHRLWHRRAPRCGGPPDLHHLRRSVAVCAGLASAGQPGALCAGEHRHWLHQRHCSADCAVAGERRAGPVHRQDAGRFCGAGAGAGSTHRQHQSLRPRVGGRLPGRAVSVARAVCAAQHAAAAPGRWQDRALVRTHSRTGGGAGVAHRAGKLHASAGRNHWHALWRHTAKPAGHRAAHPVVGHRAPARDSHADHCAAGRHRVAAVRARGRPARHGRTPPQARPQPGTDGAGRRQFCGAVFWRHAGHGHHCAHGDQPALRCHLAHRGHRARRHAGRHRVAGCTAGAAHSAGGAGGHPAVCGLEHGRVARVCAPAAFQQPLPAADAGHLLPDRGVRPDGGGRGRPGAGLRAVRAAHERAVPRRPLAAGCRSTQHTPGLEPARRTVLWRGRQDRPSGAGHRSGAARCAGDAGHAPPVCAGHHRA